MNTYLRCLKNDTYFREDLADNFVDLKVGQIYKQLPLFPEEIDSGMVRIVDGSGESYLYPAEYFEPIPVNGVLELS